MTQPQPNAPGLTLRAIAIAAVLSLFLLASTAYIALKIGVAPWPIIFSVIVSGGMLKMAARGGAVNIHEVNVAQAGASIGGLVAAGLAFTIPGLLYLERTRGAEVLWPGPLQLGALMALAGFLGILLAIPLKRTFIDEERLPYPSGLAGAELLRLGKIGGNPLRLIVILGAVAGLFGLVRDVWLPGGIPVAPLAAIGIFYSLLPMPLAVGSGYILGPRASFSWLGGALAGWILIIPLLIVAGYAADAARGMAQHLGMGMVLGSGIGFFLRYLLPRLGRILAPMGRGARPWMPAIAGLLSAAGALLVLTGVPAPAAVIALAGTWVMVTVATRMTGETNINPLEQFGIFIGLIVLGAYHLAGAEIDLTARFLVVTFVSVACAVAGDAGHDFKSAAVIGTRFRDIWVVDLVTVVVAGLAAPWVWEAIRTAFTAELFTPAMPAPQAILVATSMAGFAYPLWFAAGFLFALGGELLEALLPGRFRQKLLWMPLGIGLFLGPSLAVPIALGAALRLWLDRRHPDSYQNGLFIAAGVMGGEGIGGFSAGVLTILGMPYATAALGLAGLFAVVAVAGGLHAWRRHRGGEHRQ